MRNVTSRVLAGMCTAVVFVCLFVMGQQQKLSEAEALFRDAEAHLRAEYTPAVFAHHHARIHAKDPDRARHLLAMYFDVADQALRETIMSTAAWTGGAAPRVIGPIDRVTITQFTLTPTSFVFRAEWPFGTEFPMGKLEVLFKLDLDDDEWLILDDDIHVVPSLCCKDFEIPFGWLSWYDYAGGTLPPMGFFRIRPAGEPDWWWGGGGEEGDGDPPDFPAPLADPLGGHVSLSNMWQPNGSPITESVPVEPGQHYLVTVHCTDYVALYPPVLYPQFYAWSITAPGSPVMSGGTDSYLLAAQYAQGFAPAFLLQDLWFITIPSNAANPSIQVTLANTSLTAFANLGVTDVYIRPFALRQDNLPLAALQTPRGSTDNAGHTQRYIPEGGMAFITGQPEPPALTSSVIGPAGSPLDWISYAWRMTIETERPGYRSAPAHNRYPDSRQYPPGGAYTPYTNATSVSVTQNLMTNEIIGGKCVLYCKVRNDVTGQELEKQFNFTIRGMNPPDAVVKAFITANVTNCCVDYAWAIMRHESKDGAFVYCQFNAQENKLKWLPNKTTDEPKKDPKTGLVTIIKCWGWGISQLDKLSLDDALNTLYVLTSEVYNWMVNVLAGLKVLEEKVRTHHRFIGYFKDTYPGCGDPLGTTNILGQEFTAEMFGTCVLYNGADRATIPASFVKTDKKNAKGENIVTNIWSPVIFNYKGTPDWTFHDNTNRYAYKIAQELNNQLPAQE